MIGNLYDNYKGTINIDGYSVIYKINEYKVCLILSDENKIEIKYHQTYFLKLLHLDQ